MSRGLYLRCTFFCVLVHVWRLTRVRLPFSSFRIQFNISYPPNGTQKTFAVDNENALRPFIEKRMAAEIPADSLGDEWKGYILKITGER